MKKMILTIAICIVLTPKLIAAGLESIPADEATKWGARLAELANKIEDPQIKITSDADKANGVHLPDKVGVIVVPQKELKESEELAAEFKTDSGASLAYLFAYHLVPVVDGKPVDSSRLRTVKVTDDQGDEHDIFLLLLAVRQLADDDYRLYGYGKDKQPIVDARFSEGSDAGSGPVTVEVKNPDEQTKEGTVVITVFGKYQASFRAGYDQP